MPGGMRRIQITVAVTCILLMAALACGPLPTLVVTVVVTPPPQETVCTPLPCPEGQVPFCPGTCPGGCGLICVTPTSSLAPEPAVSPQVITPTGPPTSPGCVLGARWIADVTVPDNTALAPGTPFVKTWRMRNSGTCAWMSGTRLVFVSGDPMGGPAAVEVPVLSPGGETDVSVSLVAPSTPGTYQGNYQLRAPDGTRFGPLIWVKIVVPGTPAARVCTPPPCPPGGVLVCPTPGGCSGGCGVVCTTPTAPPSGLAILSFTAEVTTPSPETQRVTFHWRTSGATQAFIYTASCLRFMSRWEASPPQEGWLTLDPYWPVCRNPEFTFQALDAAGHSASISIIVPASCRHSFFFPTDRRECPNYPPRTTWAAEQPFERGFMIWLQEVCLGDQTRSEIIVFRNDGRYWAYRDTFVEGEPESDPTLVPPPGLYQPIRGFGKLWRTHPSVREALGWATAPEQGFYTQYQEHFAYILGGGKFFLRRLNGKVVVLQAWDVRRSGGSWEQLP
ncbi:MAG: NBR1-Ig-like domain-containing protein [Anaerolineae bacterium]|nr:NBR1-Ig-like domain-containing protein [Anaerolineae bacterium]MCX8068575.1 NBR1-Ig-like domain-containing protein [Anaerolineae bacterium]